MSDKPFPGSESQQKILVSSYKQLDQIPRGQNQSSHHQKTNLYVSGLPNDITEQQVREMFAEYGPIRSVLVKCPMGINEGAKHITSLLPIYSMAYVNFENEESALSAFAVNKRGPMSKVTVAYYVRGNGQN